MMKRLHPRIPGSILDVEPPAPKHDYISAVLGIIIPTGLIVGSLVCLYYLVGILVG